jgi:hypothetical protein
LPSSLRRSRQSVVVRPSASASCERAKQDPRSSLPLKRKCKILELGETQYQLVMALGECGYTDALATLERLAAQHLEGTMVYVALGDATVRLSRHHDHDVSPVLNLLRTSKNAMLIDGAFRGMAMLRMVPDSEAIGEILAFVQPLHPADPLRFWVAAAAPGWKHSDLAPFFTACATSGRNDVATAAKLARDGKYEKWNPL